MIRIWLVRWVERALVWLGQDLAEQLRQARREAKDAQLQAEQLQAQASARRARQAVLHEAINGLWDQATTVDVVKQGNEWKRRQLYAQAKKQYPRISDDLCALAAVYALYYVHRDTEAAQASVTPSREDV